ncbi:ribonuclease P protein subunit p40-like [Lingula anatina]|uniref:Ribonuclease P protein subunit p40-like n=1 Tax=Lingula anatina TaxID=7574 RepID=A0A1S3IX18_LINAN|nr:ribonuclease P protein subunit p40-like [Lingula anatina]|eukprot:XP_013402583.1 ribonuclease P protein subunit p40-like [Lingula anatina]
MVCCLGPTRCEEGILILNLTKDTYQELGLVGKPTVFQKKLPTKYVVEINLTEEYFTPGKNYYERVKWCLTDRLSLVFDFLVAWLPHEDQISQSSVPAYLCNKGFRSRAFKVSEEITFKKDVKYPVIDSNDFDGHGEGGNSDNDCPITSSTKYDEQKKGGTKSDGQLKSGDFLCSYTEFWEWLGAFTCGLDCDGSPDDFLSTFSCPDPVSISQSCCQCKYRGFILPGTINCLIESLRDYMKSSTSPWACVTVHGFTDSPVSWRRNEHGHHKGGENLYTFVLFPSEDYWLYMAVGTHDICPP